MTPGITAMQWLPADSLVSPQNVRGGTEYHSNVSRPKVFSVCILEIDKSAALP